MINTEVGGWVVRFSPKSFVRMFESDPRWLRRVAAAGALGLILAIKVVWEGRETLSPAESVASLVAIPACFLAAGCLLASMDAARSRSPNGRLTRILFGMGVWSIMLWCVLVLAIGFPLAIWIGTMTW